MRAFPMGTIADGQLQIWRNDIVGDGTIRILPSGVLDGERRRRTGKVPLPWERLQCYDHMMMKKNANSKVEECLRTRGRSGVFGEEKRLDEHSSQASRAKNR